MQLPFYIDVVIYKAESTTLHWMILAFSHSGHICKYADIV